MGSANFTGIAPDETLTASGTHIMSPLEMSSAVAPLSARPTLDGLEELSTGSSCVLYQLDKYLLATPRKCQLVVRPDRSLLDHSKHHHPYALYVKGVIDWDITADPSVPLGLSLPMSCFSWSTESTNW